MGRTISVAGGRRGRQAGKLAPGPRNAALGILIGLFGTLGWRTAVEPPRTPVPQPIASLPAVVTAPERSAREARPVPAEAESVTSLPIAEPSSPQRLPEPAARVPLEQDDDASDGSYSPEYDAVLQRLAATGDLEDEDSAD